VVENKDETVGPIDVDSGMSSIVEAAMKTGIEMPDLKATGTLEVNYETPESAAKKEAATKVKEVKKKDIPLPKLGSVFMFEGNEYKITYINEGQHRFTCEPHRGDY